MQPLKQNAKIGDWSLDKELGSGGQGTVWKVRYTKDKHSPPGALKLCSGADPKGRARFIKEIAILREQNDPGIVRVRDAGEFEGSPYYVMEFASASLDRVIIAETAGTRLVRESGTLLLKFLREACKALANLHARGILHRDIKPANVLLMLEPPDPMRAVLADLGVATPEAEQGQLTAAHEVVGTPAYRAPESLMGKHTAASDVYAFGKTIEFVFARGLPSGMGPGQCSRSPIFSNELWDYLDHVLQKACAFDPAQRFQNAQELLNALPEGMVVRSAPGKELRTRADTTLTKPEIVTLAQVIADCPTESESMSAYELRRGSSLSAYEFSLALRRLGELGLVEATEEFDRDERYTGFRPTDAGVRWAQSHAPEVEAAIGRNSNTSSNGADIPF